MDKHIEELFVKCFFDKAFADRLYYELSAKSKRDRFFDKIAHNAEHYLKQSAVIRMNSSPLSKSDITAHLKCSGGKCYVIAYRHEYDGCVIDFDTALDSLYSCGSPYALFNIKNRTAYLETEYDFSVHTSYLLESVLRAE